MDSEFARRLWRSVRKIVVFFAALALVAVLTIAGLMYYHSKPWQTPQANATSTTSVTDFTIPRDDFTTLTTEAPPPTIPGESVESVNVTCRTNVDCGEDREERICYRGDVYLQRVSWICRNSGKPDSYCVKKTGLVGGTMMNEAKPIKKCSQGCKDGECL